MTDCISMILILILVCSATIAFFDPEVPFLLMGPKTMELLD
jgi:hypothetical protein